MVRDKRLFMTFPIDFWMHPKVEPLSDAAFRAFVEMNGYSRMQDTDGVITARVAEKRWGVEVLDELIATHPERPLVLRQGDEYVLRDYAQHQQTRADREALVARNTANGRKGGRPRKTQSVTDSVTNSVGGPGADLKPTQKQSQESESELEIDGLDSYRFTKSTSVTNARAREADDLSEFISHKKAQALAAADRLGITDLFSVRERLETVCGENMTLGGAVMLASSILAKATHPVRDPEAYLATVCRKTPDEVRDGFVQLDIGGAL